MVLCLGGSTEQGGYPLQLKVAMTRCLSSDCSHRKVRGHHAAHFMADTDARGNQDSCGKL